MMNGDRSVTANFANLCYDVVATAVPAAGGTATVETSPNCGLFGYLYGTNVSLAAAANDGWVFLEWGEGVASDEAQTALDLTGNMTFVARFAPAADLVGHAPEVAAGGGPATFDISLMTAGEDDPAIVAGPGCQGGQLFNTVWLKVPAGTDGLLRVSTENSSFSTAIAVFTGEPGDMEQVACGEGEVTLSADPGTTYWVELGAWLAMTEGTLEVEVLAFEKWDMNCSGATDALDVLAALQRLTGSATADSSCPADPNKDGAFNLFDPLFIQRHIAGL
jgi:hypothetical protein